MLHLHLHLHLLFAKLLRNELLLVLLLLAIL